MMSKSVQSVKYSNNTNGFIKVCLLLFVAIFSCSQPDKGSKEDKRYNIVFIAVDDLRPDFGAYGGYAKTPSIDQLASSGTVFNNHYVQVPTCGASRYSLLTGLYPTTTRHLKNEAIEWFVSNEPEKETPESMVHLLKKNGYYTVGIGKIGHSVDGLLYGYEESPEGAKAELPYSWNEFLFDSDKWGTGWNAFFGYSDGSNRQGKKKQVKPYENADVSDRSYPDGITADLAVNKIGELAHQKKPFFLGVGFFKPHLPFTAPKKYWDLYSEDNIPLSPSPDIPEGINVASLHNMAEFNSYELGDEKAVLGESLSDNYSRKLRHAYYSSVSYVDAQIGKVLAELDKQGLTDNTIIILWGDHGWHLGDHRIWGKHTNFEVALRSPLIVKVPKMKPRYIGNGTVVSSVDIYPSLMEWCKIPVDFPLDGQSLAKLISNGEDSERENLAFSYFNKGISMRNKRYRLTRYFRNENPVIELYDHNLDSLESKNIAEEKPEIVEQLMRLWEKGNTGLFDL
ncbi:sulfatase [Algoriphagus sp. AGSA1]|uniref:sulfatase n=1 Tax=Algoriphagus sp. AGSA1 TaxID=2907213 RepID=UPI001F33AFEC|nr:sulfatase [Algoriphagus sp. AGSA1]MCE7057947.1 sulfatase [Algoriphagus sp. AGSA1]